MYSRKIISLLFLTNLVYVLLLFSVFNDLCHTISVLPTFSVFWRIRLKSTAYFLTLLLFPVFNDFFHTSFLKIYRTNVRQIFKFGRTMALDDRSKISFSIPQGTLPWQPIFVGLIHSTDVCRWTQVASGAAGRANAGLCTA